MNGQRSEIGGREETLGRVVGGAEGTRPRKVAPWAWWTQPGAYTPWNWSETRKQFETYRKTKAQI